MSVAQKDSWWRGSEGQSSALLARPVSGGFSGLFLLWLMLCLLGLSACSVAPRSPAPSASVMTKPADGALKFGPQHTTHWEPVLLPGKLRTAFKLEQRDQRAAVRAHADASASMLRQRLQVPAEQLGRLQFQWQIEQLISGADMAERDTEDAPARLILAFEGDRSRFSAKNAMLSDLTEALTGEPLPYATLMYVWCNYRPVGTVIVNPRSDRVRKLVVESGPANVKQWRHYERDIRADFVKAFGEAPGTLQGIAIMTDTDNTRTTARAWYGDIVLD